MRKKYSTNLTLEVRNNIQSYLRETTVHGFRYVTEGRNVCERCFWIAIIFIGFCLNGLMIMKSVQYNYENPILTTIDTVSITEVPFPAITIDGGDVTNPWGYIEKAMDMLIFENFHSPMSPDHPSFALRQDFHGFFGNIVQKFETVLFDNFTEMSLESIDQFKNDEAPGKLRFWEFERAAAMLTKLRKDHLNSFRKLEKKLQDIIAATIGQFTSMEFTNIKKLGNELLYPPIEKAATAENITDEDLGPCLSKSSDCPEVEHKKSMAMLMTPFLLSRVDYAGLGFGHLLSFFARRVDTETVFLNGYTPDNDFEKMFEAYLTQAMNKISGKDLGISIYELSKFVDPHYYNGGRKQAGIFETRNGCEASEYIRVWRSYINSRGSMPHPCSNESLVKDQLLYKCCEQAEKVAFEYESILKIKKYSQQMPHLYLKDEEVIKDFKNIQNFFVYPSLFDGKSIKTEDKRVFEPRIFMCQYNQEPKEPDPTNCKIFDWSFTNEGLGYTFNGGRYWTRHRETNYSKSFFEIMQPFKPGESETSIEDIYHESIYPETSGPAYGLKVFLKLNPFIDGAFADGRGKQTPVFKVAIHDPRVPADLRSVGVEIEPGYISTFLIAPSQIQTLDELTSLETDRRKCQFRSENKTMKFFRDYSTSGCLIECQVEIAFQKCGCIPWNYPHLEHLNPKTCDYMGAFCFEKFIADTDAIKSCDCPYDCDSIRYSYSVSSTIMDVEKMCDEESNERNFGLTMYNLPNNFMNNFEKYVRGIEFGKKDICRRTLKNMAIVNFQLSSQIVTKITRRQRVSLADYISNFGGLIGLFTGMSLLSVIEIVFWLLRLFAGSNKTDKPKTKKIIINRKRRDHNTKQNIDSP